MPVLHADCEIVWGYELPVTAMGGPVQKLHQVSEGGLRQREGAKRIVCSCVSLGAVKRFERRWTYKADNLSSCH